jgi:hypothetical protein
VSWFELLTPEENDEEKELLHKYWDKLNRRLERKASKIQSKI